MQTRCRETTFAFSGDKDKSSARTDFSSSSPVTSSGISGRVFDEVRLPGLMNHHVPEDLHGDVVN
jgi:hypothetical protein